MKTNLWKPGAYRDGLAATTLESCSGMAKAGNVDHRLRI